MALFRQKYCDPGCLVQFLASVVLRWIYRNQNHYFGGKTEKYLFSLMPFILRHFYSEFIVESEYHIYFT